MPLDGEMLGDPRLRHGLAYYPAVSLSGSTVAVGNVVQLQLQTVGGSPYLGYGQLKGIWLWRDQPFVRVQYLAPVQADPPDDAIMVRGAPEVGAITGEPLPGRGPAKPEQPQRTHPPLKSAPCPHPFPTWRARAAVGQSCW